ncbi:hypothetical protein [Sulfurimonas sp.]|uniref:hypothetical protein n=1 Tax=Sulfurimonas sp. TaxID=2022749 RepID=UPI00286DFCB7|nr:hypothetical protein [Sulfurimonas sp.]
MKISKIYSNNEAFKSIVFDTGINFILSDDHSVGKSTLFELLDFCLLKGSKGFLSRDQFRDFTFYLELELDSNSYLTIIRPITGTAKISVKVTNHSDILLDTTVFDKTGGVDAIKKFIEEKMNFCLEDYRKYLTYFLRDQDNQSDIFVLNKFVQQKHIYYKPLISNLLGIDGSKIRRKYELDNEIETLTKEIIVKENDLGSYRTKESILEEISVYEKQASEKEELYSNFDFYLAEKGISTELVSNLEEEISTLNQRRNSLNREIDYINKSLEEEIAISGEDIEGLFDEMKLLFPSDLKENYDSVINFNKQIMEERVSVFKENKIEFLAEIENIEKELFVLNKKRVDMLSVLKNTDTMEKFKELEKEVINFKTKIDLHKERLTIFDEIASKKAELQKKKDELVLVIKENKTIITSPFILQIKSNLIKYGKMIFNRELAFSIGFNTSDNIDFSLKVENSSGFDNALDEGHTIKKLLCFIFAVALAESYSNKKFFKFVAFDSPFDGDKNTYQDGVYNVLKELESKNIQTIITSVSDVINNANNLKEIRQKYTKRFLSESDKLIGDF